MPTIKFFFFGFTGITIGAFVMSVALWIGSRIVLPELGLPTLPFGVVFWATFWIFIASGVLREIIKAAEE